MNPGLCIPQAYIAGNMKDIEGISKGTKEGNQNHFYVDAS